jgi:hypothetical protein
MQVQPLRMRPRRRPWPRHRHTRRRQLRRSLRCRQLRRSLRCRHSPMRRRPYRAQARYGVVVAHVLVTTSSGFPQRTAPRRLAKWTPRLPRQAHCHLARHPHTLIIIIIIIIIITTTTTTVTTITTNTSRNYQDSSQRSLPPHRISTLIPRHPPHPLARARPYSCQQSTALRHWQVLTNFYPQRWEQKRTVASRIARLSPRGASRPPRHRSHKAEAYPLVPRYLATLADLRQQETTMTMTMTTTVTRTPATTTVIIIFARASRSSRDASVDDGHIRCTEAEAARRASGVRVRTEKRHLRSRSRLPRDLPNQAAAGGLLMPMAAGCRPRRHLLRLLLWRRREKSRWGSAARRAS